MFGLASSKYTPMIINLFGKMNDIYFEWFERIIKENQNKIEDQENKTQKDNVIHINFNKKEDK